MRKILLVLSFVFYFYSFANDPYIAIGDVTSVKYKEAEREFKLICDSILKSHKSSKSDAEQDIVADIRDYIKIKLVIHKDTVDINDLFLIDIVFTNTSNKTIAFYPKGFLSMSHVIDSDNILFTTYPDYCLRAFPDFRDLRYLGSNESLTETYEIRVEPYFFSLGNNPLEILYSSYDYTDKKLKKIMRLYGVLKSDEFKITVKPQKG